MEGRLLIRGLFPTDRPCIFATLLNSYWASSPYLKGIHKTDFYNGHKRIVERLLNKATTVIACDPEDKDHIYGYLIYDLREDAPHVLHYVYVKGPFRKFGIATHMLLEIPNPWHVSHWTDDAEDYLAKGKEIVYNPYLAL